MLRWWLNLYFIFLLVPVKVGVTFNWIYDIEGVVTYNSQTITLFELGLSSDGGFLKSTFRADLGNASLEVLGQFKGVRYRDASMQVKTGDVYVYRDLDTGEVFASRTVSPMVQFVARLDNEAMLDLRTAFEGLTGEQRLAFVGSFGDADVAVLGQLDGDVGLVGSWRVLNEAGETNLINRLDDIEFVDYYLKNNPSKVADDVISDITNVGGFSTWKIRYNVDEAVVSFYSSPRDEMLSGIIDDAVIADDYDKLLKIFGLDESLKGQSVGSTGKSYDINGVNNFDGEVNGDFPQYTDIQYLDEVGRQKYEVFVKDGELYVDGSLLSSKEGKIIFVLGQDGKIYSGTQQIGVFHHSSFLSGVDVSTAGEFKFIDGVLEINAKSGHYTPPVTSLELVVDQLIDRGFDIRKISIDRGI